MGLKQAQKHFHFIVVGFVVFIAFLKLINKIFDCIIILLPLCLIALIFNLDELGKYTHFKYTFVQIISITLAVFHV